MRKSKFSTPLFVRISVAEVREKFRTLKKTFLTTKVNFCSQISTRYRDLVWRGKFEKNFFEKDKIRFLSMKINFKIC